MARVTYTPEQRAQAVTIYTEHGPAAAEKATGIKSGTIRSWASRAGAATVRSENLRAHVEAASLTLEQRRLNLASGLLDDIGRLREQLFAPCTHRQVVTVGTGKGYSRPEVVDVDLAEPTFPEKARIMVSIGIAVDKVQLLTGQATSRIETADPRERALAAVVDLDSKRRAA